MTDSITENHKVLWHVGIMESVEFRLHLLSTLALATIFLYLLWQGLRDITNYHLEEEATIGSHTCVSFRAIKSWPGLSWKTSETMATQTCTVTVKQVLHPKTITSSVCESLWWITLVLPPSPNPINPEEESEMAMDLTLSGDQAHPETRPIQTK